MPPPGWPGRKTSGSRPRRRPTRSASCSSPSGGVPPCPQLCPPLPPPLHPRRGSSVSAAALTERIPQRPCGCVPPLPPPVPAISERPAIGGNRSQLLGQRRAKHNTRISKDTFGTQMVGSARPAAGLGNRKTSFTSPAQQSVGSISPL